MQEKQPWWGEEDPDGTSWKTGSLSTRQRQEIYIEWLVAPKAERTPRTKKELAEELGVTPQTLRNYSKDPRVQREVMKRGRGIARSERALDVVNRLYERALEAESEAAANTAAKLFLEWTERQLEAGVDSIEDMSDEELVEKLVEIQQKLQER